jgi:hypothetical protein
MANRWIVSLNKAQIFARNLQKMKWQQEKKGRQFTGLTFFIYHAQPSYCKNNN